MPATPWRDGVRGIFVDVHLAAARSCGARCDVFGSGDKDMAGEFVVVDERHLMGLPPMESTAE